MLNFCFSSMIQSFYLFIYLPYLGQVSKSPKMFKCSLTSSLFICFFLTCWLFSTKLVPVLFWYENLTWKQFFGFLQLSLIPNRCLT